MGSGKLLKFAVEKHGLNNFKKEILHIFESEEEMNVKEAELVEVGSHTYNLCPGGKGGWGYVNENCGNQGERLNRALSIEKRIKGGNNGGRRCAREKRGWHAPEVRARRIDSLRLVTQTESWKEKQRAAHLGKKMPDQSGEKNSQYGTFWITNGVDNAKTREYIPENWKRGRSLKRNTGH